MLRLIYTAFITLLFPVILLHFWWRGRKQPGYRQRIRERFGFFAPLSHKEKTGNIKPEATSKKVVWVHAVSVGEVFAARKLIQRLLKDDTLSVVVTTITPTGSDRVTEDFGQAVFHVYAPIDIPLFVNQFLKRTRPSVAVIIETELWPNILRACDKNNIPAIVANARLSERSARGYRRFHGIAKTLFNQTTIIAAQNKVDGDRFLALGLKPNKLEITGSVKFDIVVSDAQKQQAQALRKRLNPINIRPILIAASTHTGEDEIVLSAFRRLLTPHPRALLIIVPRHPDNFEKISKLASHYNLRSLKRTQLLAQTSDLPLSTHQLNLDADIQVLVGDTMGELMLMYGVADMAFIGGSLIERGGHNMIEAAAWGIPCLSGQHVFNFADISEKLAQCGGMEIVCDESALYERWLKWLDSDIDRHAAGAAARSFFIENQGALDKLLAIIYGQIHNIS